MSRAEVVRLHALMAIGAEGPREALPLRKHLIAYSRGSPHAAQLRRMVSGVSTLDDALAWAEVLARGITWLTSGQEPSVVTGRLAHTSERQAGRARLGEKLGTRSGP